MTIELRDLELLNALARAGTIERAADLVFLSVSATSRQLSSLERRMGVALFTRRGGRLRFTARGELLLHHARRILAMLREMETEVTMLKANDHRKS